MAKHTQIINRQTPTNCLSVFDHFVVLALKGLGNLCCPQANVLTEYLDNKIKTFKEKVSWDFFRAYIPALVSGLFFSMCCLS